ncbi:CDP-alcohol phosphatidyltransferase family protein [Nocardioides sp. MAH-18]|uniref:Phosphatidylinositol phosphate synthase n=1 Tax=Nocardioides agri TaxID=2682843 RepID=A0A6L6XM23_9ACTN|nr:MULTISPECIES: CDP-alcohol phosphatidyltransferase family protein [unclassified Nocardioides]MBA2953072.1 CDP-alcohol phosphatidyltransferase family protein [Nocardioides sp. CGMCC 1.13656]MVQ47942.1 CDP-alcohol phosphatidyltransferase family protein [Nocardioides sp. MAH-18]
MMERFRAFWTKVISPIAHLLLRLGVSPDAVTLVGTLGVCAGALIFFPQGELLTGCLVITAFVFSDLLDGTMARTSGRVTKFGAFWDSTLDRIGDGAIFMGLALYFAWEEPSKVYLVLSLVCLLMGAVTSYARSRGETLGFDVKVGIAERADRLVLILVMTAFSEILDLPILLPIALWTLAIASTITVGQRVWVVRRQALAEARTTI